MQKIVLLNESKSSAYSQLVSNLAGIENVIVTTVYSAIEFENFLKNNSIYIFILTVEKSPSQQFLEIISKNRNLSGFRRTHFFSIHQKFLDSGIQKILMAGAKTIYLEPIDHRTILQSLTSLLVQPFVHAELVLNFKKVPAAVCTLDIFGRIGQIFTKNLGDLQIETDAVLHLEQKVQIRSQIAEDLARPELEYRVRRIQNEDTYYNYGHSYALSWVGGSEYQKPFLKWMEKNKKGFSLPKTKVLWVSERSLGEFENVLSRTLFSVHTQTPRELSLEYLTRLNPRILIRDRLPQAYFEVLQRWLTTKVAQEVLLISTEQDSSQVWNFIAAKEVSAFEMKFLELVKPFLNQRIPASMEQAKYLDRKSNYSRFALRLFGRILEVDVSSLVVESQTQLEIGTIFYLNCPPTPGRDRFAFYVKVIAAVRSDSGTTDSQMGSTWRLTCTMIPISDRPELAVAGWTNWGWEQLQETGVVGLGVVSRKKQEPQVFFVKKRGVWEWVRALEAWQQFLLLLLVFGVAAGLYWVSSVISQMKERL